MADAPTMHRLLWPVSDLDVALRFYVSSLGMSVGFRDGDRFAAVSAGAEVVVRSQPGPHELRAVLRDPSGHLVVLYQASGYVV